jgi:Protein of unknown function (DUF3768)
MEDVNMDHHEATSCAIVPRAEVIARLNDQLRKTCKGGTVVITQSVRQLDGFKALDLITALAEYGDFDENNDPHGERDFGDLTLFDTDLLWKIDYYDSDLKFGSDDPANADLTHRVLTIMTAADW